MREVLEQLGISKQEKYIMLKALNMWRSLAVNEDKRDYKNDETDIDAISDLIKKIKLLNFK